MHRKSHFSDFGLLISGITCRLEVAVLAFFFVPSPVTAAGSLQLRVHIPEFAEVQGDTIRLSDLLPPDAPAELEQMGARIALGDSPDPACQRVLSKHQIELRLREFPSIREQLELPERLVVSCKHRQLSTDEVWTAIASFLAAERLSGMGTVLERLPSNQPTVFVTKEDPGLVVKRMEPDRVRRQIRFLLWTSKQPQLLPFYVTVHERPGGDGEVSAAVVTGSGPGVTAHKAGSAPAAPAIILVNKGKPAKLVVETQTLRMTALVTPLESGAKGQVIRVRNMDTQRVFKAEVAGEGLLQAEASGE